MRFAFQTVPKASPEFWILLNSCWKMFEFSWRPCVPVDPSKRLFCCSVTAVCIVRGNCGESRKPNLPRQLIPILPLTHVNIALASNEVTYFDIMAAGTICSLCHAKTIFKLLRSATRLQNLVIVLLSGPQQFRTWLSAKNCRSHTHFSNIICIITEFQIIVSINRHFFLDLQKIKSMPPVQCCLPIL